MTFVLYISVASAMFCATWLLASWYVYRNKRRYEAKWSSIHDSLKCHMTHPEIEIRVWLFFICVFFSSVWIASIPIVILIAIAVSLFYSPKYFFDKIEKMKKENKDAINSM